MSKCKNEHLFEFPAYVKGVITWYCLHSETQDELRAWMLDVMLPVCPVCGVNVGLVNS